MSERILSYLPLLLLLFFLPTCSTQPRQTVADYLAQGDQFLASGDVLQAIASYRMALFQDSLDAQVLGRLSRAYARQGNTSAADMYLRRATNLTYQAGLEALQRGDTTAATTGFTHTIELHPGHPLALNQLGDLALARGDQDQALDFYQRSIRANPYYADSFVKLGRLEAAQGRRQEAEQAFVQAITANLNAVEAYMELGRLYLDEQKWVAAADQFDKVLRIDPQSLVARAALDQAQRHL